MARNKKWLSGVLSHTTISEDDQLIMTVVRNRQSYPWLDSTRQSLLPVQKGSTSFIQRYENKSSIVETYVLSCGKSRLVHETIIMSHVYSMIVCPSPHLIYLRSTKHLTLFFIPRKHLVEITNSKTVQKHSWPLHTQSLAVQDGLIFSD